METFKTQLTVSVENIDKAFQVIKSYASDKDFEITGNLTSKNFTDVFPSHRAAKRLRRSLNRVIDHATMKNVNLFLHFLAKNSDCTAKVEYSAKEKSIQAKRKAWKDAQKVADTLFAAYKQEKGDYYIAL